MWEIKIYTARKTILSFSRRPEKMVFPKKLEYDYSCIIGKDDISFSQKIWSYTLDGKWRMIFLKKHTEIWCFLQTFWKDGLSKKSRAGTWSFLYYLERWYFFPKTWSFFPGQKVKHGLPQEIQGNMMHRPAKKNRKPDI